MHVSRLMRRPFVLAAPLLALSILIGACGGGGGGGGDGPAPGPQQYTIGGSVAGLADGATIGLALNGGPALQLGQNGSFAFPTPLEAGASYAVTVAATPEGQDCTVAGGSGTASADVTSVQVSCIPQPVGPWWVRGSVSGMAPGGHIVIANRNLEQVELSGDGSFSFHVADGADYAVWVKSNPAGQLCRLAPASGVAHANVSGIAITCRESKLSVLTGSGGGPGYSDGVGTNSRFNRPGGTAVDADGNVYVADRDNNLIRKITPAGVVSTVAGSPGEEGLGWVDGVGAEARFCHPTGIAVDGHGTLFVADGCNSAIRQVTADGTVTTFAGTMRQIGSADGTGGAARFYAPTGIALDGSGNLYVADSLNCTLRKITPSAVVTTLAGSPGAYGYVDGPGPTARFSCPVGVAVDPAGTIYVADAGNRVIRKVTPAGVVSTFAGTVGVFGNTDGGLGTATFGLAFDQQDDLGVSPLAGLAVGTDGNLYVADYFNHEIRRVASDGQVTTIIGQGGAAYRDGRGTAALMNKPTGLAFDAAGNLYAAEDYSWIVRKITPSLDTSTFAGRVDLIGHTDGARAVATFRGPRGIASDAKGNLYVADWNNNNVRRVAPDGTTVTWSGTAGVVGTADGYRTDALFYHPRAVGVDRNGTVYLSDDQTSQIRAIDAAGWVSSVTSPDFGGGYQDGPIRQARFERPTAFAFGPNGEVYIADAGSSTIRKMWQGTVSTFVGPGCGHGDGPVAAAQVCNAEGIAIDDAGNLFVADTRNGLIRKITPDGIVSTVAGQIDNNSTTSVDGFGSDARFFLPRSIAIDSLGNLYVTDGNCAIRLVTPAGGVTTIAGRLGQCEVHEGPLPALAGVPMSLTFSPDGRLLVTANDGVLAITGF